jgi:hypothetical protein
MARIPLGYQAKAYINTSTTTTPTWTEIDIIRNVTLNLEKGDADVTTRGAAGWKEVLPTLKEASIDCEIVWDADHTIFTTLLDAFINDKNLEFLFLDGAHTKKGSQGLRAVCGVFKFSRDEQLDGALMANTSFKPTYGAVKPSWYTVTTGTP